MFVFISHAWLPDLVPGGFGVTVFFFLSGYLITTFLRMEYENSGTISFKKFYLRRVLRIFPPFYLVLIFAWYVTYRGWLGGSLTLDASLSQALHYVNYRIIYAGFEGLAPGSSIYWSLAVEEHFYLLFPLLYVAMKGRLSPRSQVLVLAVICAAILAWRYALVYEFGAGEVRTNRATDTRADSILFGCMLAICGNPMLDRQGSERWMKWFWLPLALIALLVCLLVRDPKFRESYRYTIQGIALFPVFISAIRFPNWGAFRLLNLPAVKMLGVLSYSMYLLHYVIIKGFEHETQWPTPVIVIASLATTITISWLIYRLVEKPFSRMRVRLNTAGTSKQNQAGPPGAVISADASR